MKKCVLGFFLITLALTSCIQGESTTSSYSNLPFDIKLLENNLGSTSSDALSPKDAINTLFSNDELLEQLIDGDISNLIITDKYPDKNAFEMACIAVKQGNFEWLQCDVNRDGYDDLVLQEAKNVAEKMKRIIAVFSANKGKLEYHLWDVNDGTEYYFMAQNANLIYFYDSYGTYSLAAYHHYVFDENWNKKCIQRLTIYNEYDYDNDVSTEETIYERDALQTADGGTECQKEELITKEQFFEDFLNMTGVSFYDMKPVDLILWDEE